MADQQLSFTDKVQAITPAATMADTYVEFSFSGASMFGPGQTIEFSWQLNSPNPSSAQWTQTQAWSFNAADTGMTAWNHIVVMVSGAVAYGDVPM